MRLLFTRSKLPLSAFIRLGTGQPTSHFAIGFDDCLLFQSNLLGVGIEYLPQFLKAQTVVHEIRVDVSGYTEEQIYKRLLPEWAGKQYDYGAFIWSMWRTFLRRVFGVPLPPKSQWGKSDRFLCVGIAKSLDTDGVPDELRQRVRAVRDFDTMMPEDLYQWLLPACGRARVIDMGVKL